MKEFVFDVTHDNGVIRIKTWASNKEQAKRQICEFEGCPERAVKHV